MAIVAHGPRFNTRGMTSRSAASRAGSLAPMTVRRMTSRVISDILGPAAMSCPTGQPAILAAAASAMTVV